MTYEEILKPLSEGKIGMLPKYNGYFYYDYFNKTIYMKNGDYKTYDIDNLKTRTDWFYII